MMEITERTLPSVTERAGADPGHHSNHATTSMVAIASEGRFERSENLIAQRAAKARRSDASDRPRFSTMEGR
ncbi:MULTISPECIES: hypothetical protein [unclassified Actinomadura]|uniref:hypothetical protein n=1 Tax=unclassified Actinomadura TaxID=2626254 RepID=UPI0011ECF499|nr:hypothetical protein [Actinomadura sp. K4S16]